jgi:alanine racemase
MDMLMVDVTEIDCTEGTSVIVFMKAQLFRKWQKLNTIPYEVLTSISQRKGCFIDKIVFRAGVTFRIYILDNSK